MIAPHNIINTNTADVTIKSIVRPIIVGAIKSATNIAINGTIKLMCNIYPPPSLNSRKAP